jgi:1,5-anhydro-D-fructose reductase (1,5-anhydro-D-mannitol-forming)
MTQHVRWGIIGCGDVVERKSGAAFQRAARSELVAVMRRSGDLAEAFARRHGVPIWTTNADDVINNPDVDAVYIATPPVYHLTYALRVCAAGKPCLVEKPAGRSAAECRQLVTAFKARGVPLFVAYYRRYLPKFLQVKETLDSGVLGPIVSIQYRYSRPPREDSWRVEPRLSGGGLFWDLGCHVLDLFDFWFGPLELTGGSAASRSQTLDVEDTVALSFRTAGGTVGTALWNFASPMRSDRLEIDGQLGKLTLAGMKCWSPCTIELTQKTSQRSHRQGNRWQDKLQNFLPQRKRGLTRKLYRFSRLPYVHEPLIRSVVDSILDQRQSSHTDESALRTSCLMDSVLSTYYGGREDAFWERSMTWQSMSATSAINGYRHTLSSVTERDYQLSEEQVGFFFENGYLGPFTCESPDLSRLDIPLEGKINQKNRHLEDALTLSICSHPSVVDRVAQLLGSPEIRLFKSRFWVKGAENGKPVPWHQDVGFNNGGFFADGNPVPTVTVWLAIDPATETSGAVKVVPGSHRRFFGDWKRSIRARLEEKGGLNGVDLSRAVLLDLGPGEFYIFHSWILHGSGPNSSEGRRAALNMRFVAPGGEVEPQSRYLPLREASPAAQV